MRRPIAILLLMFALLLSPATAEDTKPAGDGIPRPTGGQLNLGSEEGFGFGTLAPDPTALYGASRIPVVLPGNSSLSTISIPVYYAVKPTPRQRFLVEAEGDNTQFGVDMSYSMQPQGWPGVLTGNAYVWRARMLAFEEGRTEIGLLAPGGAHPWIYQAGGGVEYTVPLTPRLQLASALNYRQFTVHSGAFTGQVPPFDELLDPLTVDPDGVDEILSARVVGLYNTLDDLQFPTRGTKLRFGAEQTIPVGNAQISSTRFQANFTQFIPMGGGPTLIFNLQGGTMFGRVPGYEAYALGGVNSVRGWEAGALGTGQSFLESTLEYRFPITKGRMFGSELEYRGAVFVDYATDFDSAGGVLGRPAVVRQKPGEGSGLGVGLHVISPIGLVRFETAVNNLGDVTFYVTVGDRY